MIHRLTLLSLLLAVLGFGAACGGEGDNSADDSSAKSPQPASELAGTYERAVTKADMARTAKRVVKEKGFVRTPPGPHRLVIEQGSFTVTELRENFSISQFLSASEDGTFDIGDYVDPGKGAFCGPRLPQGAIYSWALDGDVLSLKAESDSCADRDSVLSGNWRRK